MCMGCISLGRVPGLCTRDCEDCGNDSAQHVSRPRLRRYEEFIGAPLHALFLRRSIHKRRRKGSKSTAAEMYIDPSLVFLDGGLL